MALPRRRGISEDSLGGAVPHPLWERDHLWRTGPRRVVGKSPAVFDQIDASVLKIAEGLNCSVSPVQDDAQQEKEDTQDGKSKHHNGIV